MRVLSRGERNRLARLESILRRFEASEYRAMADLARIGIGSLGEAYEVLDGQRERVSFTARQIEIALRSESE